MLNSNLNIYGKAWLDVVFDSKNKTYGAYQLRRQSANLTTKALLMSSALFILLFLTPKIISLIKGRTTEAVVQTQRVVEIQDPPTVNPAVIPPPITPPAAKVRQTEFRVPLVVVDDKVNDIEPPTVAELKESDPGQKTIAGVPDGELVIVIPPGDGPKQAAVVEDETLYNTVTLEVQPSFPGGINKFYDYLRKTVRYPALAQEQGIQGKAFMSFVIERNGTLTDITVANKVGGGIDEEAIRVLKASPPWIPGIQNGAKVRVKFNIPISFSLPQ